MRGNTFNYLLTVHHKYPNFWWNFQFFGGYCHAQWFPSYSGDRNSQVPSNVNICRKTKVPNDYRSVASISLICFSHFSDLSNVNICRNTKALSTPIVGQFFPFLWFVTHKDWLVGVVWKERRHNQPQSAVSNLHFFRISVRLCCVLCSLKHTYHLIGEWVWLLSPGFMWNMTSDRRAHIAWNVWHTGAWSHMVCAYKIIIWGFNQPIYTGSSSHMLCVYTRLNH